MKFEAAKSPYGPDDEIGRLNEITASSTTRVDRIADATGRHPFRQVAI